MKRLQAQSSLATTLIDGRSIEGRWWTFVNDLTMAVVSAGEVMMAQVEPKKAGILSGYADDQVIGRRELEADALLLEKPFTRELLGRKVREALAAGPGRRSAG